jgi:protein TonB
MKHLYLVLHFLIIPFLSSTKATSKTDTAKTTQRKVFYFVEIEPVFPGGVSGFYQFINTNLQYPEVARLLGINGTVTVSFWIDKTGKVIDVSAQKSLGAGTEYEAAKVVSASPHWRPGIQNGHPVKVQYKVDVNFDKKKRKIAIKELKASSYGFVFNIKGKLYTLDETETQLGEEFKQAKIESTELFYNPDNDQKFVMPEKKEVYLINIKS